VDAQIDNPRALGIPNQNWSARWTGQVQAPHTGTFTFTTASDDGIRLWVNDQLLIDQWTAHGAKEDSGTIELEAGRKYPIWLEYFQGAGDSVCRLYWSSDYWSSGDPVKTLIPQSQLYSAEVQPAEKPSPSLEKNTGVGTTVDRLQPRR
jgi:hypothetical protein